MLPTTPISIVASLVLLLGFSRDVAAQGWVCAHGGSLSGGKTRQVEEWITAKSKRGPVVILGYAAPDAELEKRFLDAGAASVRTLVIETPESANLAENTDVIRAARAVWIRGGDQWKYVAAWRGTYTEAAIRSVFDSGGVVGGTSAGCAILGEVSFDAMAGSLMPRDSLRDGRPARMSLSIDFLGLVPGVVFDTHFTQRARLTRMVEMIGTTRLVWNRDVAGIGLDEATALGVGPDGIGEVLGDGTATIVTRNPGAREVLDDDRPPAISDYRCSVLAPGSTYRIAGREAVSRPEWVKPCAAPIRPVLASGIRADGSTSESAAQGGIRFDEATRACSSVADAPAPQLLVVTRLLDSTDLDGVRMAGVMLGLAQFPGTLALALDTGATVVIDPRWSLSNPGGMSSALVIDGAPCTFAGTRGRSLHFEGARLDVIPPAPH